MLGTDGVFDVLSNQVPLTVGSSHSAAGVFERKVLAKSRPGWQTSLSNCLQRMVALHADSCLRTPWHAPKTFCQLGSGLITASLLPGSD